MKDGIDLRYVSIAVSSRYSRGGKVGQNPHSLNHAGQWRGKKHVDVIVVGVG